jgi:3-hydroxyacyl-CoA dehydrogenase
VVACATLHDALDGATYVQESGPEILAVKREIFAGLDQVAQPAAILASSVSTMDMTEIAAGLPGCARCIVAHPVNPPHVVPVVEVLGGRDTHPSVVTRTVDFLRAVGQTPVVLKRFTPGFLLNRMQAALVLEAMDLLARDVADVDAIDAVIRDGLGLRWALMGPFGVANTNADGGVREYFTRYGEGYLSLGKDLKRPRQLDADFIERVGRATDAMEHAAPRPAIRQWRDLLVRKITQLKRAVPHPGHTGDA